MTHYADLAISAEVEILDHRQLATDTRLVRLAVPDALCAAIPGQFFMLRDARSSDPLIGRAFAMYDVDPQAGWIDLVYLVKGKLTSSIVDKRPGDHLCLWGPLGNGFDDRPTEHLIMVAGGIGQTPFLSLAREATGRQAFGNRNCGYAQRVSLCYGVRSSHYLAGLDAFQAAGAEIHVATEDGSIGRPQRVTEVLTGLLDQTSDLSRTRLVCCGPEPMMQAVARIASQRGADCQVSLETPMACGIGICFTCVAKVGSPSQWDYQRTCVEGPVFDAAMIVWDDAE
ncbi:MAG: dihydroorotate dehydrogenase electron transfer subunit [Pirellulaceae bacterium]|nr:dihydroorotate dehydrogenase electron transfer subunit [Pirellulaceae bacterium]